MLASPSRSLLLAANASPPGQVLQYSASALPCSPAGPRAAPWVKPPLHQHQVLIGLARHETKSNPWLPDVIYHKSLVWCCIYMCYVKWVALWKTAIRKCFLPCVCNCSSTTVQHYLSCYCTGWQSKPYLGIVWGLNLSGKDTPNADT